MSDRAAIKCCLLFFDEMKYGKNSKKKIYPRLALKLNQIHPEAAKLDEEHSCSFGSND